MCCVIVALQSPILGNEVHQFPDLGYLGGTHSSLSCHSTFSNIIPSYTMPLVLSISQDQSYHHTIPAIPYPTGWLKSIIQNFKNNSAGCYTSLLGTISYRSVLDKSFSIKSHKTSLSSEINAFNKGLNAGWLDSKFLPTLSAQGNVLSASQPEISFFY